MSSTISYFSLYISRTETYHNPLYWFDQFQLIFLILLLCYVVLIKFSKLIFADNLPRTVFLLLYVNHLSVTLFSKIPRLLSFLGSLSCHPLKTFCSASLAFSTNLSILHAVTLVLLRSRFCRRIYFLLN